MKFAHYITWNERDKRNFFLISALQKHQLHMLEDSSNKIKKICHGKIQYMVSVGSPY